MKQLWMDVHGRMNDQSSRNYPLPPLCEQKAVVERARQALEEQMEAINRLPAAILIKAFEGRP